MSCNIDTLFSGVIEANVIYPSQISLIEITFDIGHINKKELTVQFQLIL